MVVSGVEDRNLPPGMVEPLQSVGGAFDTVWGPVAQPLGVVCGAVAGCESVLIRPAPTDELKLRS